MDLDDFIPAYLTWLANRWARSASALYLKRFGIGFEAWRIIVLLAIEGPITANRVCQVIGMDKASVSRNFKGLHQKGLLRIDAVAEDGRQRLAQLTRTGFELHGRMLPLVLQREGRLLACLTKDERDLFRDLLRRVYANLDQLDSPSDYESE
ncbi:MarR family winged helix-turn-helix transcriptional regulator [Bradyrhizobium liaoningense]|uniref:MarR family winged helix-turn-helix transcriptional regulator n=1 Tax=Bradyrhizobium liaoningense TaxID=43992 RepID=UPI001BAA24D1|nr:MarR family transcriptional regulator [Bradyrhizobium liaoningense]MBR0859135.1 MarR family transcriptional regulator [Bradyrhizobium liaoningense]